MNWEEGTFVPALLDSLDGHSDLRAAERVVAEHLACLDGPVAVVALLELFFLGCCTPTKELPLLPTKKLAAGDDTQHARWPVCAFGRPRSE